MGVSWAIWAEAFHAKNTSFDVSKTTTRYAPLILLLKCPPNRPWLLRVQENCPEIANHQRRKEVR